MSEKYYSVVFRGDIVVGENLDDVKLKLKKIFKADDSKITALFSGRAVSLKTKLNEEDAKKYQRVLKQAGVIVSIELAESSVNPESKSKARALPKNSDPSPVNSSDSNQNNAADWELAPVGSLLQDKQVTREAEISINLEHLTVMPQEGNLLSDSERIASLESTIDVDLLEWELTPYGEALIKEEERVKVEAVDVDISYLDVTEKEGNLIKDNERNTLKEITIDTSHLSLIPDK